MSEGISKGTDAQVSATPPVRVVSARELDLAAHAALQQRVFGSILEENGIPLERLGSDVFAWKHRPPRGEAQVAIIEQDGALLASCTALPIVLATEDRRVGGWHLCDAATAPESRGRGFFGRVLSTLREALPADEWVFAFPNGQSRGAFERQGFTASVRVPLWFRPVIGGGRLEPGVEPVERFGVDHDELAERLAEIRPLSPLRTAEYLSWRYPRHPYFRYQSFELRREGRVEGLLVLNRMEARGRTSLWVMELLAIDREGERTLARHARALAKAQDCDVVLSMAKTKLPGAFRLPACFLPKEHVLMVRRGGPSEPADPGAWDVQTGDWDTF